MAFNTGVSLKYETNNNECISIISGIDLCKQKEMFMKITYGCGIIFIGMLVFVPKVFKDKPKKK